VSTAKVVKSSHTKGHLVVIQVVSVTLPLVKNAEKQYIGQTGRKLSDRFGEHLYNICQKKEVTGLHILYLVTFTGI
jgi:hypothetical protein